MKTKILFLVSILMCSLGLSQTKPIVENYPLKAMDLAIIPFGAEYPITIGTISDSGELNFKLPTNLPSIPEETKENFMTDAAFALFSKCDNSYDILTEDENIKAAAGGNISLSSKENPYNGLFFMVSDEKLVPWLEDSYSNSAVTGSYFELIYVVSDFNYQGTCTSTSTYAEDDTLELNYIYDLELKAGFNFIEYKIESVNEHMVQSAYEENVFDKIAKPSKITVTSSQSSLPNTKWIGKYF